MRFKWQTETVQIHKPTVNGKPRNRRRRTIRKKNITFKLKSIEKKKNSMQNEHE